MTEVMNLATGEIREYPYPPTEAVQAAARSTAGDPNNLPKIERSPATGGLLCGDWCCWAESGPVTKTRSFLKKKLRAIQEHWGKIQRAKWEGAFPTYADEQVSTGRIAMPGKFEGEMLYVPYFWDQFLNGFGDELPGGVVSIEVAPGDRFIFPELGRKRRVRLYERSDGFVCEA